MPSTKRLLLVQPSLQPPGGGNVVAAWAIQALKDEHEISVLTWRRIDLEAINRYAGTTLRTGDFHALRVPAAWRALLRLLPLPLAQLRASLLLRDARRRTHDFDLCLGVNNEADFGRPGIQYVHFPWAYLPRPAVDLRWYHGSDAIVAGYHRICARVAGFSFERMRRNLTLVNSDWTAAKVRECHGIEATTLHPPVPGSFPDVPWAARKDGFVAIGRFSPEKELDKVIDVVAAVRARGHEVHLHLAGTADDVAYTEHVRRRAEREGGWVFVDEGLSRDELVRLVAKHRYGIHGMTEEHFGMAIAEMVRAGMIVFVPRGGGQTEIVDGDERLLYTSPAEAAAKIDAVLRDEALRGALRSSLEARRELFSVERFTSRLRELVRDFRSAS